MRVSVIGCGYVGLVTGVCLAEVGHQVWCVDVDEHKINMLQNGIAPIYEQGLTEMIHKNQGLARLNFTTNMKEAFKHSEICFITVGTPMRDDGSADLQYILSAAEHIGKSMIRNMCIVVKSTVPVGTADLVRDVIQKELDKRESGITFTMVSNPEFLREGSAVQDCMKPDRIIIGADTKDAVNMMRELYKPYDIDPENFIIMDTASAEMTKYAANSMLATKISFINEIANICERVGADINQVQRGISSDHRIGPWFINPGCGYGGSCFPKDMKALIKIAEGERYDARLLQAVEAVNIQQKEILVAKVKKRFGANLHGKIFSVWGLAFKPDTEDMRESAAIPIIERLTEAGAVIQAYDPKAMEKAKSHYLRDNASVIYYSDKYEALKNADALILITEWREFQDPDFFEIRKLLRTPAIFDGRNQYNSSIVTRYGIDYYQIGVRPVLQGEN